jgi:hypothetical protein
MPNLTASIPHQLTRVEVKQRIQEEVVKLRAQQGSMLSHFEERWVDDRMTFSVGAMGQSISGHIDVDDRAVHVEVALPWLLGMLAAPVKQRIEQQGRNLLSHSPKKGD